MDRCIAARPLALTLTPKNGPSGPTRQALLLYKLVNKRSDSDLGNTQTAPRSGERAAVC